ncbi:DinB family protein [Paenibacillus tianjinensis]|uniref:DinB family protein n=1 Tax=Paenibacillus tianjinensis TaxID=2810347 RepID=A0ABX7LIM0_9BACL|nr:DinB family protein [Paenibacillus tianjinensis]QSF47915.1 DinB family protein [Paenibacillus tianjinensis]
MSESNSAFGEALVKSLIGERGHIPIARALPDITSELAGQRTEGIPYSIYQLLKHMSYWQDFMLTFLEGGKPQAPGNVRESWPVEEAPVDEAEWQDTVRHLLQGVEKAVAFARTVQLDEPLLGFPGETKGGILRNIASHNSYHLGEIVILRRLHGAWPPPGGGYPA